MKLTIQVVIAVAVLTGVLLLFSHDKPSPDDIIKRQQGALAAQKWFDNAFKNNELVTSVGWNQPGVSHEIFVVRVDGRLWRHIDPKEKLQLLKTISNMNQMRGSPAWVTINDHQTGETYAEVMPPSTVKVYR